MVDLTATGSDRDMHLSLLSLNGVKDAGVGSSQEAICFSQDLLLVKAYSAQAWTNHAVSLALHKPTALVLYPFHHVLWTL